MYLHAAVQGTPLQYKDAKITDLRQLDSVLKDVIKCLQAQKGKITKNPFSPELDKQGKDEMNGAIELAKFILSKR